MPGIAVEAREDRRMKKSPFNADTLCVFFLL